ncbi:response regulator transcription factor [Hoyosella subflava]|uniref:Two component transcriptional regulator, LuxR family n=1 Tax=Hoyosella subflava (strain DSM 45089 / JCM 17490 / NBRC 109087 / DQS3-9A1) TaxID=443218 RepID=F6EJ62_HOYSD|nr:response regulator transcription factor [Hoyosella subflava]AEF41294.1 Two component transcriptional regulator, LuxR family [Hoyosella subflava DQS3-9A1]
MIDTHPRESESLLAETSATSSRSRVHRIGLVEDQQIYAIGLSVLFSNESDLNLVAIAPTVSSLLKTNYALDLVIVDLRFADGPAMRSDFGALQQRSIKIVLLTSGDDRYLIRSAARWGAFGVILKSDTPEVALDAIRLAAADKPLMSVDAEWTASLDAEGGETEVRLPERQQQVLALYAAGEKAATVARRMNLSVDTVNDYITRIRRKYAEIGRPAPTKMDLYKRALEDGWLPVPRRRRGSTSEAR